MRFKVFQTLLLSLVIGLPCFGQEQPRPAEPLTADEIREGTLRIEQAVLSWEAERLLKDAMRREQELSEKERDLASRELETEKQRTALAERETALQKDRGDFYEQAFKQVTKGRSAACKLFKVLTLGLGKCA